MIAAHLLKLKGMSQYLQSEILMTQTSLRSALSQSKITHRSKPAFLANSRDPQLRPKASAKTISAMISPWIAKHNE
jgi:hypothetical protein